MAPKLSFFNWSLTKLLSTEPDEFRKARISIIYTVIILTQVKLLIAMPVGYMHGQDIQVIRSGILFLIFIVVLKFLLVNKDYSKWIGGVMIWMALLLVWTNLLITAQSLNIITIQTVVMVVLCSFYLVDWKWALTCSFLGILPVFLMLAMGHNFRFTSIIPEELASPAFEIIVVLNFITMLIAHFLYFRALNNNILEKGALNLKLQQAVKEANLAVKSKADFLSTMSHELRTPLNSVIGMTQLLLNSPYTSEQTENLKIVNFSAMNLHMLINDILDFNKMESDKLILESIDVDLNSLVHDISAAMRFQAEEKGLQLIVNIDQEIDGYIFLTDPTRLTQIIHNLLGNAIKFTHEGKICLDLHLTGREDETMEIKFSVKDSGIGISEDKQIVIFEAFTQASSSTTRNFGGTGLGLAIVKRLLALFDSTINLVSSEGEGSEFFFSIRFNVVAKTELPEARESAVSYDLSGLRVLVVEDNPINTLLLKKILLNWNNHPSFAINGYEAIEKIESSHYDVILMDIHMPLLDGYETSRIIRDMSDPVRAGTPIIALTASVSHSLHKKIKAAGMNDYINKPFNSDDLYRKLKGIRTSQSTILSETESSRS